MQPYLSIIVIVGGLAYSLFTLRRSRRALAQSGPALIEFFERTGYQYADLLGRPPQEQAARALEQGKQLKTTSWRYVRDFHGVRVEHCGAGTSPFTVTWTACFAEPRTLGLHILDKSLRLSPIERVVKAAKRDALGTTRSIRPRFAQRLQSTGVVELDRRYDVYTNDPDGAVSLLRSQPGLVALFDRWTELNLVVDGHEVVFDDAEWRNMSAATGGVIGNMALGFDQSSRIQLAIPVHERIAELLLTLGRACA